MNADRLAFDELRLEGWTDKRCNVGARLSSTDDLSSLLPKRPTLPRLALDQFLRAADGVDVAQLFQAADDERFEQNERHLLRQTALVQFQFRSDQMTERPE